MADKQINLNAEAKNETFDLTLHLDNGSSDSNKKRKIHNEENVNLGQAPDDRITAPERKLQQVKTLIDKRAHELAARIDQHFLYSVQSIHEKIAQNSARLNDIHSILHSIIMSFRPGFTSELQKITLKPGGSFSGSKKPPPRP